MGTNNQRRRHRSWPESLKREIVAASLMPGASVLRVAQRYDVNYPGFRLVAALSGYLPDAPLRLDFDRCLGLQFRGSAIISDAGLLAFRELDDALRLIDRAADSLTDERPGKNGRHWLARLAPVGVGTAGRL